MKSSEMNDRKTLSKLIHDSFEYPWNYRARAMEALRAMRPNRRRGKWETMTYNDIFHYLSYQITKLELDDQLVLTSEVVDLILRDKKSYEAEWSGLIYIQSVIRSTALRGACNPRQKQAIRQFISYLINWRLKMHGCEIFRDQFEATLEEWGP